MVVRLEREIVDYCCIICVDHLTAKNPFSTLTLLVGDRKDILPGRCGQEQIETTALSIIL